MRSKAKMMEKLKNPPSPVAPEQRTPLPPVSPTPLPSPASAGDEAVVTPSPTSPTSPSPPPPNKKSSPSEPPPAPLPHNVPVISLGYSKPPTRAEVPTTQLTALHPIPSYLQLSAMASAPPPPPMPLAAVRSPLLGPQYQPHPFLNRLARGGQHSI